MVKKRLINLILVLVAVVPMLFLGEWIYKKALFSENLKFENIRKPQMYSKVIKHKNGDLLFDDFWKLNRLINHTPDFNNPDTLLGWTNGLNRKVWIDMLKAEVKGKRPVLIYGDSFAQCVDSVLCFEDFLNADTAFIKDNFFVNLGIGGYGLDQIYLLLDESIDEFENPFVIFSLLTTDLDRSMLRFRDAQKPYFEINGNELELKGVPITKTTKEYLEDNPIKIHSYLWERIKNSSVNIFRSDEEIAIKRIEEIKKLNEKILDLSIKRIKNKTENYMVLLFHPVLDKPDDWRFLFVRNYLEENKIPYLCDIDIRYDDPNAENYNWKKYCIEHNGHPTSVFNEMISHEIKDVILKNESKYLGPNDEPKFSDSILIPKTIFENYLHKKKSAQ